MRSHATFVTTTGLLLMLLSVTGFTALATTEDPSSSTSALATTANPSSGAPALGGLELADIDCADLISADALGHEISARYGLAEKLQDGRFAAYEFLDYIICSTREPEFYGSYVSIFANMSFMFDRGSGQLVVTYLEWEGSPAEAAPTPTHEPIPDILDAAGDDSQTTTVCIDATTPILEIGGESPEQFDFWGILAGPPCQVEMSGPICLECGEDVIWRWLVPAPTGQGQESTSDLEGRGGRTCFDVQMAAQITGQEIDDDDARRLAKGICDMQMGPGDQVCWQCVEDTPEPTPTPVPTQHAVKDPVCSEYLTPEVVGPEAWQKYGIADKLRRNEIEQGLDLMPDSITCRGHQKIEEATVIVSELFWMLDIESGRLLRERVHWREDLPEHLPPLRISQGEAEAMAVGRVTSSKLAILVPELVPPSDALEQCFHDPCWFVTSRVGKGDGGATRDMIINAITGEVLSVYSRSSSQ